MKSEKEMAAEYGSDVRTVRRWKAAGAPLNSPEKMEVWIASRHRGPDPKEEGESDSPKGSGGIMARIAQAKLDKVLLECQRLSFRNKVERKEYIATAEYRTAAIAAVAEFRAGLQALRGDAPSWAGLPPEDIDERARVRIDEAIECLRKKFLSIIPNDEP